jgi:hypothetical protein
MSLPIDFGKDNKVYGLLFPIGFIWQMSFYSSERGRKTGMKHLQREITGQNQPILKFELSLTEIYERGIIVPFLQNDYMAKGQQRKLENIPKPNLMRFKIVVH